MSIPESKSGYPFKLMKRVKAGDFTMAHQDYNAVANNADWLQEAKVTGWSNQYSHGDETSYSAYMWNNDTGVVWVAGTDSLNGTNAESTMTLIDVASAESGLQIPIKSFLYPGLTSRLLTLTFAVHVTKNGDPENYLPYGKYARKLASNSARDDESNEIKDNTLIRRQPLFAGPGSSSIGNHYLKFDYKVVDDDPEIYEIKFWVNNDGDLCCTWTGEAGQNHIWSITLHGMVEYGPQWRLIQSV